jgi:hypothetical protein
VILLVENISQTKVDHYPNENYLPVELVYFYPQITANIAWLYWGTATEVNNYGYDIERSDSSQNWEVIGFVFGHGISFSPKDYSFADSTLTKNGIYFYRLKQIDTDGVSQYSDTVRIIFNGITSVEKNNSVMSFKLNQNYPNPFNPTTIIDYQIPEEGYVTLKLFNSLGNEVTILTKEYKPAGKYNFRFSAIDVQLSSGIYFYKIEFQSSSKRIVSMKKMILIK